MELALTTLTRGAHVRARVNIERESRVEQIEVEAIVETPASMRTINTREGYMLKLRCFVPSGGEVREELREVSGANISLPGRRVSVARARLGDDDGWGEGASRMWSSASAGVYTVRPAHACARARLRRAMNAVSWAQARRRAARTSVERTYGCV